MPLGLLLSGTRKDEAALAALCERCPEALEAEWQVVGPHLVSEILDPELAVALAGRGFPVVEVQGQGPRVQGLLEALEPYSVPLELPEEALFSAPAEDPAAGRLLTALAVLERGDARISEIGDRLLARVQQPPVYLLHRARDEGQVIPYVRAGQHLFVAWGWRHPLAGLLDARIGRRGQLGLCGPDGEILRLPAAFPSRELHDALRAELPHRDRVLSPIAGERTFPIQIHLGLAEPSDPELFLLEPEELDRLEPFVEASPPEDTARLLLSRLGDPSGRPRYLLREALRPQLARLGPQLASLLRKGGYCRAPGFDALYLPVGRRLVPTLRRDDLRRLIGLEDGVGAVIVDQDADGILVTRASALDDTPLSKLVTFLAIDRRLELDRLFEEALLSFPQVEIERPAAPAEVALPAVRERVAVDARPHRRPPRTPRAEQAPETPAERDLAERRMRAAAQEEHVLERAIDDGAAWRELGRLHWEIGDGESAIHDLGAALFLDQEASGDLLRLTRREGPPKRRLEELLELAVIDWPTHEDAVRTAALVLGSLADGDLDESLGPTIERLFQRGDLPISRRLQWAVLRALASANRDEIGLVRAKEALLGSLNAKGLTETLDLPRFVRHRLATAEDGADDEASSGQQSRSEQLAHLERMFVRLVPQPLEITDARDALLRAVFANGLARMGGAVAELFRSIDYELEAHDPPVRVLLGLYLSRLSFVLAGGSEEAWKAEVERTLSGIEDPRDRRMVGWVVGRSCLLRTEPLGEPPAALPAPIVRILHQEPLTDAVEELLVARCFDIDRARGVEGLIDAALRTGRDQLVVEVSRRLHQGAGKMRILASRARVIGACLRAGATVGDTELVEACLDDAGAIASDREAPSVRELLVAVRPALLALRRVGASDAARRFLGAFAAVTELPGKESGPLCAAVALGYFQLGDEADAAALRDRGFERVWAPSTPHVDRYEAGEALLEILRHWPLVERARICDQIAGRIQVFADSFTTRRHFPLHQLLIAERLVECLVDAGTARSDRVQGWLDVEEARVRKKILADCRQGTGVVA